MFNDMKFLGTQSQTPSGHKAIHSILNTWWSQGYSFNFDCLAMQFGKHSLGCTTRNHLIKIIWKLDPILEIKFHLLIHWFIWLDYMGYVFPTYAHTHEK